VKTRYCIFNGYIHQGYRKVEGEWKITGSHTSGLFVDSSGSRRCQRQCRSGAFQSNVLS
jgi:hypothetical protein